MTASKTNCSGNVLYFQSGGPTQVINATFQGLFDAYLKDKDRGDFFVSGYGLTGILEDRLIKVKKDSLPDMRFRPGSYFGSLRKKLPEDSKDPLVKTLMENIKKNGIRFVFVNGGNDSMNTAYRISQYAKDYDMDLSVIGIPKTIDNDLYGCDHTPGFGSAAKYVANCTIATSVDDKTYDHGRVNVIETMGRDSGFLAASAVLASLKGEAPDYIFVPEVPFSMEEFLSKVKTTFEKKHRCLVVVSEGIRDKDGNLIASDTTMKDSFNHTQVGGVAKYLSAVLSKEGIKNRGIELSVLNRASGFLPSLTDIKEAMAVSRHAYQAAKKGHTGVMMALGRKKTLAYAPDFYEVPLEEVSDKVVTLPKKYINKHGDNITPSYIDYVLPLVKGNALALDENGLMKI